MTPDFLIRPSRLDWSIGELDGCQSERDWGWSGESLRSAGSARAALQPMGATMQAAETRPERLPRRANFCERY